MKAYRNVNGTITEINVDIALDGQPILPPNTTVAPRPEVEPGHYLTVVGNSWVQIAIPVTVVSFETLKANKAESVSAYREKLLEQPVEYDGILFDGDDQARTRITQALVMFRENGYVPPLWITFDNSSYPLADIDALRNIGTAVQTAFSARFYECSQLRAAVTAAKTSEELDAIVIPKLAGEVI